MPGKLKYERKKKGRNKQRAGRRKMAVCNLK
jgi:hypothetical protein